MLYGCYEVRIHPPMTLQKHCCHFLISTGYEGGWDSFKNCYNSTYLVLASGIFLTQLTKKWIWCCARHVHQLVSNELGAFTWDKANRKTTWVHTAARGGLMPLKQEFRGCWIPPGHCGSSYKLLPQTGWSHPCRRRSRQVPTGAPLPRLCLHDPLALKESCDGFHQQTPPQHPHPIAPLALLPTESFCSHISTSGCEIFGIALLSSCLC